MNYDHELEVALAAARKAGAYLKDAYAAFTPIPNAPASISTEADRTSQDLIIAHLMAAFPDDAICAEEGTDSLRAVKRTGSRLWVVDPIDGTRGFAMKNGEFSTMIGFAVDGEVVAGVVLEPALDRVTYAAQARGCFVQIGDGPPTQCRVTATSELTQSTLVQSHSRKGEVSGPVNSLAPKAVVETYSAGVKLAMVARGDVDIYVNTYTKFSDWDICAGDILVTEAGGQVSELRGTAIHYGRPGNLQAGGLLATNGRLHAAAVRGLS